MKWTQKFRWKMKNVYTILVKKFDAWDQLEILGISWRLVSTL
jgi:hypothetical protein